MPLLAFAGRLVMTFHPCSGCEVQVEPSVDVGEVVAGDLGDSREPITKGVAMDGERPSGLVVVAAAVEIGREGWDEVGAVELVIVEQPAEPVGNEAFDLGGILFDREDANYAEIRIGSGAAGFAGLLSRCQRSPSLGERARDLLGCESGLADGDLTVRSFESAAQIVVQRGNVDSAVGQDHDHSTPSCN